MRIKDTVIDEDKIVSAEIQYEEAWAVAGCAEDKSKPAGVRVTLIKGNIYTATIPCKEEEISGILDQIDQAIEKLREPVPKPQRPIMTRERFQNLRRVNPDLTEDDVEFLDEVEP